MTTEYGPADLSIWVKKTAARNSLPGGRAVYRRDSTLGRWIIHFFSGKLDVGQRLQRVFCLENLAGDGAGGGVVVGVDFDIRYYR